MKSKHINNETFLWSAAILLAGSIGMPRDLLENPAPIGLHEMGLARVHEGASDLDQVFVDVSNPALAIAPDTAENFIGRITVNARSSHKNSTQ